nr:cation acetate symporter [Streptomyces antimycoticus]
MADNASITPFISLMLAMMISFLLCLIVGISSDDRVVEFFSANRSLPAAWNILALCGDHISTTVLLSGVGAVSLGGYDGMVVALSAVAGFVIMVPLAEPLRNTERFTLGGVLESRIGGSNVRTAGAVVTIAVCVPLSVIQLVVVGDVVAYVLGLNLAWASQTGTILIGLLVVSYAAFGGMRGTSLVKIGNVLLTFGVFLVLIWTVLKRFDWEVGSILETAGRQGGGASEFYSSGTLFGETTVGRLNLLSLCLTLALGPIVLPHIVMRIASYTHGVAARRAATLALPIMALIFTGIVIVGLSAAALVGSHSIAVSDPQGYSSMVMLVDSMNSKPLVTLIACAVFITALSTLSGLLLSAAASVAHDLYAHVVLRGRIAENREVALTRWVIVIFGAINVFLAVAFHHWNVVALVSFAAALTASTVLPALVYGLFWKGFTNRGLLWTLYGSLTSCVILEVSSLAVSGRPQSLLPQQDFHWFPLEHIGLVTIPAGFLLGWLGSQAGGGRARLGESRRRRTSGPSPQAW